MEPQKKTIASSCTEQTVCYAIAKVISEAKRRHKKISVEINGINLTVSEESDIVSTRDLYIRLLVPILNKKSEEIWEKIQEHLER